MKKIQTTEAAGHVISHDITRIIRNPRFPRLRLWGGVRQVSFRVNLDGAL